MVQLHDDFRTVALVTTVTVALYHKSHCITAGRSTRHEVPGTRIAHTVQRNFEDMS